MEACERSGFDPRHDQTKMEDKAMNSTEQSIRQELQAVQTTIRPDVEHEHNFVEAGKTSSYVDGVRLHIFCT